MILINLWENSKLTLKVSLLIKIVCLLWRRATTFFKKKKSLIKLHQNFLAVSHHHHHLRNSSIKFNWIAIIWAWDKKYIKNICEDENWIFLASEMSRRELKL